MTMTWLDPELDPETQSCFSSCWLEARGEKPSSEQGTVALEHRTAGTSRKASRTKGFETGEGFQTPSSSCSRHSQPHPQGGLQAWQLRESKANGFLQGGIWLQIPNQ